MNERDVKAHNRSVQDDKPRTKLSKEMQEFIVWVAKQKTFVYIEEFNHWGSFKYSPKSTLQLLIHFQKKCKEAMMNDHEEISTYVKKLKQDIETEKCQRQYNPTPTQITMTTEQQKEFTDAIETRLSEYQSSQEGVQGEYEIWDDDYWNFTDKIKELEWVLTQFNKIKNKKDEYPN